MFSGFNCLKTLAGTAVPIYVLSTLILVTLFSFLVALGLTGSSLGIGLWTSPATNNSMVKIVGANRPIRSDEWAVFTPMAIGQYNHLPPFPVVNKNLGPDGQNMLIVGMTGVPVWHLSALARPATWGFFVLDLPHALAWYWWFPAFGCIFALWALLARLFPGRCSLALALSCTFVASPYVVAWSFWPAYTVMFPVSAIATTLWLVRLSSWFSLAAAATLLGLTIAGFVLVLYPAWQVPLGYLSVLILVGIVFRDRLYRTFHWRHAFAILGACVIAGATCLSWYIDARVAIKAMMETVYPGQRVLTTGGDVQSWYWSSGLSNMVTLYADLPAAYTNQSEAASFLYMILPIFAGVLFVGWKKRKLDPIVISILIFMALTIVYQSIGFSPFLAEFTLWGRSTGTRADVAQGLAQFILIGFLLTNGVIWEGESKDASQQKIFSLIVSVIWIVLQFFSLRLTPHAIHDLLPPSILWASLFGIGAASYLLLTGQTRSFILLYMSWTLSLTLSFNPISQAPKSVTADPLLLGQSSSEEGPLVESGRVIVLGSQIPAMMLLAAGRPVLNGIHFYPQHTLWQTLDPDGKMRGVYNRYQHLLFVDERLPGETPWRIETPQLDVVRVHIDARRFDFQQLGVNVVMGPTPSCSALDENPHLKRHASKDGWTVYKRISR